jgi:hypothetical protein
MRSSQILHHIIDFSQESSFIAYMGFYSYHHHFVCGPDIFVSSQIFPDDSFKAVSTGCVARLAGNHDPETRSRLSFGGLGEDDFAPAAPPTGAPTGHLQEIGSSPKAVLTRERVIARGSGGAAGDTRWRAGQRLKPRRRR